MGRLKAAVVIAYEEKTPPYVTLTPQQPYVGGRGFLYFYFGFFYPPENRAGFSENNNPYCAPWMAVAVNFETKGTYLMTFTVINSTYPTTTAAECVIQISRPSSFNRQKFLDKNAV